MHRVGRLVAVVGVQQDPVGQHLDALADAGELVRRTSPATSSPNRSSTTSRVECCSISSRGRALGHDLALVHDDQPVAELLGLVHVVRGQHERDAPLLEPEQPLPHQVPGLRIEAGRRFVEQHELGLVDQRPGDREPPLHAAGQRLDLVVGPLGELDEVEQLRRPLAGHPARNAEVARVDGDVLRDGQLGVERVLLGAHAEPTPDLPGRRATGSRPRMRSVPPVGGDTQPIIRIVEDLPAPLGPRKPNASPGATSTSIPSTAVKSPKRFTSPRAWIRGSSGTPGP